MLSAPLAANAQSGQLYSNNFESGLDQPPWGTAAFLTNASPFTNFVGRFGAGHSTILYLETPVIQSWQTINYTLTFDLYTIDRWEGTAGADYFDLRMNGDNIFHQSFSTNGSAQTFRAPDIGPAHLGFDSTAMDAIYRNIVVPFNAGNSAHIGIVFDSSGLGLVNVSSWGVDNVRINYTIAPAPAGAGLLALAGAGGLRRRRR